MFSQVAPFSQGLLKHSLMSTTRLKESILICYASNIAFKHRYRNVLHFLAICREGAALIRIASNIMPSYNPVIKFKGRSNNIQSTHFGLQNLNLGRTMAKPRNGDF